MKNTRYMADIALTESGEATLTIYQSLCGFDGGREKSKAKKKNKF